MSAKNFAMKKAYILLSVIFLMLVVGFWLSFSFINSSYTSRTLSDTYTYLQAKIIADNAKELSKYFLYQAKKDGKQCLNSIIFSYPSINDRVKIDYFYAFAKCKNDHLVEINKDANLSKDGIIIVSVSVVLNQNSSVNEEIVVQKNLRLLAKENFWKP